MNFKNIISIRRLGLHIKKEIYTKYRSGLIAIGAVTGILVVIDLLPGMLAGKPQIPNGAFYTIFILLGLFFSSRAFSEIHDEQEGLRYLTTPGSELERILTKLIVTNLIYIILGVIYFYLVTLLLKGMNLFFFDVSGGEYSFQRDVIKNYFVLHSVFFFGSVYFKSYQTIKLLFSGFVIFIILTIYSVINTRIIFGSLHLNGLKGGLSFGKYPEYFQGIYDTLSFIFRWVLVPYFWSLTYLRLKEQEV